MTVLCDLFCTATAALFSSLTLNTELLSMSEPSHPVKFPFIQNIQYLNLKVNSTSTLSSNMYNSILYTCKILKNKYVLQNEDTIKNVQPRWSVVEQQ